MDHNRSNCKCHLLSVACWWYWEGHETASLKPSQFFICLWRSTRIWLQNTWKREPENPSPSNVTWLGVMSDWSMNIYVALRDPSNLVKLWTLCNQPEGWTNIIEKTVAIAGLTESATYYCAVVLNFVSHLTTYKTRFEAFSFKFSFVPNFSSSARICIVVQYTA